MVCSYCKGEDPNHQGNKNVRTCPRLQINSGEIAQRFVADTGKAAVESLIVNAFPKAQFDFGVKKLYDVLQSVDATKGRKTKTERQYALKMSIIDFVCGKEC